MRRFLQMYNQMLKWTSLIGLTIFFYACGQTTNYAPNSTLTVTPTPAPSPGPVTTPPCTTCRIFVSTTSPLTGMLGATAAAAITAADNLCQMDSGNTNGGTYKAMLVSSVRTACTSANCTVGGQSENLDWVLHPSTAYTRPDGTAIGTTNAAGIFIFPLTNAITAAGGSPRTGFSNSHDWTSGAAANNCADWTSNSVGSPPVGNIGNSTLSFAGLALQFGGLVCSNPAPLYCVEQ